MKKLLLALSVLSLLVTYGCNRESKESTETKTTQEQTERYPSDAGGGAIENPQSASPGVSSDIQTESEKDMEAGPDAQMETERDSGADMDDSDLDADSEEDINP